MARLQAVVEDMLNTVVGRSSHHISSTLQRGLQVDMKREGSDVSLLLSRDDTYPSRLEWEIVCSYFPDEWSIPEYEELENSNRYWLRTKIAVPEEVEFGKPIFKLEK